MKIFLKKGVLEFLHNPTPSFIWIFILILIFIPHISTTGLTLLIMAVLLCLVLEVSVRLFSNHMLYPYFNWRDIDETLLKSRLFGLRADALKSKINKRYEDNQKPTTELNELRKLMKEYSEYDFAREAYYKKYFYMIQANNDIINNKKKIDQIRKDERFADWDGIYDDDGKLRIMHWLTDRINNKYLETLEWYNLSEKVSK